MSLRSFVLYSSFIFMLNGSLDHVVNETPKTEKRDFGKIWIHLDNTKDIRKQAHEQLLLNYGFYVFGDQLDSIVAKKILEGGYY